MRSLADRLGLVIDARRRLGLYESNNVRAFPADELAAFLRIKSRSPRPLQPHHLCAMAACHFCNTLAEIAVHQQRELLAGFSEVGHSGLHSRTAGARHGHVEMVARRENRA